MKMNKWSASEAVVFGAGVFCLMLALVVAPVSAPGIASAQWVPLGIAAFLAFEFTKIRRRRITAAG